jgi:hypothetical protein
MANSTQEAKPFRFMSLPFDLRLIIYERWARTIKYTYIRSTRNTDTNKGSFQLIIITRHIPTAILSTCRKFYYEAKPIIKKLINAFILSHPPRMIENRLKSHVLEELVLSMLEYSPVAVSRPHIVCSHCDANSAR